MTPQEYDLHKQIINCVNIFNEAKLEHDRYLAEEPPKGIVSPYGTYHQEKFEIMKTRKFLDLLEAKLELEKAQKALDNFQQMEDHVKKQLSEKINLTA